MQMECVSARRFYASSASRMSDTSAPDAQDYAPAAPTEGWMREADVAAEFAVRQRVSPVASDANCSREPMTLALPNWRYQPRNPIATATSLVRSCSRGCRETAPGREDGVTRCLALPSRTDRSRNTGVN